MTSYAKIRPATTRLLEMMDEGLLDAHVVAEMCLSWLSESSVHEMMLANDLVEDEPEDEPEDEEEDAEEWTPDNADFNDPGSRHHY
jgi:hypothetical protein